MKRSSRGALIICTVLVNGESSAKGIPFPFKCAEPHIGWARQMFSQQRFVLNHEHDKPILVSNFKSARDYVYRLGIICEFWHAQCSTRGLWSWSIKDLEDFFSSIIIRIKETEDEPAQFYSYVRMYDYIKMFDHSYFLKMLGHVHDGISFNISLALTKTILTTALVKTGLNYERWRKGGSYPAIPLPIAATLLSKAIQTIESDEASTAKSVYAICRKDHHPIQECFPDAAKRPDILQRERVATNANISILSRMETDNHSFIKKLPWPNITAFSEFRRKICGAGLVILFTQSGYRYDELTTSISTETKQKGDRFLVKQTMGKTHRGIRYFRPLAQLSAKTAMTLWSLSPIDSAVHPLPLFHNTWDMDTRTENAFTTDFNSSSFKHRHQTLLQLLNDFYQQEVIPAMPEAAAKHPRLTFHQFRHTFAEFTLRRFDEDVHVSLREHFAHLSEHTTRVYEELKLSAQVSSLLEMDYLRELIGRAAAGKLDQKFWGPAFKRIKNEIEKVRFLSIEKADTLLDDIVDLVERFAVFEWGFCVLFRSSKSEAKCHDAITGLPDVEGNACPELCSKCPNNMGNRIQGNNLARISVAHSAMAEAHPVKAIGKLSADIAEQISKRLGESGWSSD